MSKMTWRKLNAESRGRHFTLRIAEQIEMVDPKKLVPNPGNAGDKRHRSTTEINKRMRRGVTRLGGIVEPILAQYRTDMIINGVGRHTIALIEPDKAIAVLYVDCPEWAIDDVFNILNTTHEPFTAAQQLHRYRDGYTIPEETLRNVYYIEELARFAKLRGVIDVLCLLNRGRGVNPSTVRNRIRSYTKYIEDNSMEAQAEALRWIVKGIGPMKDLEDYAKTGAITPSRYRELVKNLKPLPPLHKKAICTAKKATKKKTSTRKRRK
jgi:hypothetical protein